MNDRITALRAALTLTPGSDALRVLLAEALADAGEAAEACVEYERLLDVEAARFAKPLPPAR